MGKKEINNEIVLLRHLVRKSRVRVIHNLTREIKILREKRGDEKKVAKFQRRAERLQNEVMAAKKIRDDEVTKFAINNERTLYSILNEPSSDETLRVTAKFADFPQLKERVIALKEKFPDYEQYLGVGRKKLMKQEMKAVKKELKNKEKERKNAEAVSEENGKNKKKKKKNENSDDEDQKSEDEDEEKEEEEEKVKNNRKIIQKNESDDEEEEENSELSEKSDDDDEEEEEEENSEESEENDNDEEESENTDDEETEDEENTENSHNQKAKKSSKINFKSSDKELEDSPANGKNEEPLKNKKSLSIKNKRISSQFDDDNNQNLKKKKSKMEIKQEREIHPVSDEATVKKFSQLMTEEEKNKQETTKKPRHDKKFQELGLKKEEDSFFTTANGDSNYMSIVIPKKQIPNSNQEHYEHNADDRGKIGKKFSRSKNESFFSNLNNSQNSHGKSRQKSLDNNYRTKSQDKSQDGNNQRKSQDRKNGQQNFESNRKQRRDLELRQNSVKIEKKSEEHLHPSWMAKKKQQDALKIGFQGKKIVFGDE